MPSQWNAILQIDTDSGGECVTLQNVPLVDAVQIAIKEDAGAPRGVAQAIYQALLNRLTGLGHGRSISARRCTRPRMFRCRGRQQTECRCYLVLVTGNAPLRSIGRKDLDRWQRGGAAEDVILPVLPHGSDPGTVLPAGVDKTGVVFHHGRIDDTADTILHRVIFSGSRRRVFISYRRADVRELADQLFDAFGRAGFQVFLDRFSGTPGRLFPEELCEEIIDQGLVVVLESPNVRKSPWTLAEVAFAFLHRIGLIALNVDAAPRISLIDRASRFSIKPGKDGRLAPSDLDQAVDFVRSNHASQVLRRRVYLEILMQMGLATRGMTPVASGSGTFRVSGGGTDYLIGLAERAPGLADVRRVCESAAAAAHPVVMGSSDFLPMRRRQDLAWLAGAVGVDLTSEYRIVAMAQSMANGNIPL